MAEIPPQPFSLEHVPALLRYNVRARRYILRVKADGTLHVTVPRGGNRSEAMAFAQRKRDWILRQRQQRLSQMSASTGWHPGTQILFRGLPALISFEFTVNGKLIKFADQQLHSSADREDYRPFIETHLWRLAKLEVVARAFELARLYQAPLRRVCVRNQRSRWGSCSSRGTVSLNWRLIQMPPFVRDYLIVHELAHFKQMNHSDAYWRLVETMDPNYLEAEKWLRHHGRALR
jgi:predicted metal-dependent hydrolase